jgi:hypothetical protein
MKFSINWTRERIMPNPETNPRNDELLFYEKNPECKHGRHSYDIMTCVECKDYSLKLFRALKAQRDKQNAN